MRIALRVDGAAIRGNEVQAIVIARELKRRSPRGRAMLEALAAGVPVMSTAVSGAADALEPCADGSAPGASVGSGDDDLASALGRLLGDADLRARMGEARRRRTAERFGFEAMPDRREAVLRP